MDRFDPAECVNEVRRRVERARQRAGGSPVLLVYDANAIQQFLSASDRLHAMRGASAIVKAFDDSARGIDGDAACLFAGGGRGLMWLPADRASAVRDELVRSYREVTHGGSLAVAIAPLGSDEAASLRLARQRLAIAKDEAPPPHSTLFEDAESHEMCADCHQRPVQLREVRRHESTVSVCGRCQLLYERGLQEARDEQEQGLTFEGLSKSNRIAVVSADGNEMGRLFSSLHNAQQQAVVSVAVDRVFRLAIEAAKSAVDAAYREHGLRSRGQVTPVAGGDDVRAFVGPEVLVPFLETLVGTIEDETDRAAGALALDDKAERAFRRVGLGAGVVVAPVGMPARRLVELAHRLEVEAKRVCGERGARSALRLAMMRSGDELSQSGSRDRTRTRALVFSGRADERSLVWSDALRRARALAGVGKSQRAQLRASEHLDPDERTNLFRYQVARNRDWQRYYDEIGMDWKRKDGMTEAAMPSWTEQELARLVELATTNLAADGGARRER